MNLAVQVKDAAVDDAVKYQRALSNHIESRTTLIKAMRNAFEFLWLYKG